jgi:hypothetical protein
MLPKKHRETAAFSVYQIGKKSAFAKNTARNLSFTYLGLSYGKKYYL